MDEKKDKKTKQTPAGGSPDGEYHFVRPEQRLYEDAEFVPQNESLHFKDRYAPEERKPRDRAEDKARSSAVKTVCLCLACAIIGGLAGGYMALAASRGSNEASVAPDPAATAAVGKATGTSASSANDIYALGCRQTVCISLTGGNYGAFGESSPTAGTGFVITRDGYILTNYHVIEAAENGGYAINVSFKDKTSYQAAIAGTDKDNDVAVLKIDATALSPATLGDSDDIKVGDYVYTIGNPLGELDFSMTSGRVSALDRSIVADGGSAAIDMFQLDASINPGNSGGPVYNDRGEVVGIATAKAGGSGAEGVSFAIPINDAAEIAKQLIERGHVGGEAYMGVNIDSRYTSVYARYYNMPEGAYVYNVEAGSCAEKAGLAAGDIITRLDNEDISCYSDLCGAIKDFAAGQEAELTIYRSGKFESLEITFDESKPGTGAGGVSEFGASN